MFGIKLFILISTAIVGLNPASLVSADCAVVSPEFGGSYGALQNRVTLTAAQISSPTGYHFQSPSFPAVGGSIIKSEVISAKQVKYHLSVTNNGATAGVTAQVAWFNTLNQNPVMKFSVTATGKETKELCIVVDSMYTTKIATIQMTAS